MVGQRFKHSCKFFRGMSGSSLRRHASNKPVRPAAQVPEGPALPAGVRAPGAPVGRAPGAPALHARAGGARCGHRQDPTALPCSPHPSLPLVHQLSMHERVARVMALRQGPAFSTAAPTSSFPTSCCSVRAPVRCKQPAGSVCSQQRNGYFAAIVLLQLAGPCMQWKADRCICSSHIGSTGWVWDPLPPRGAWVSEQTR